MKIALIGDSGSGKTSLLLTFAVHNQGHAIRTSTFIPSYALVVVKL
jgi:GTPase SAR1 family protein